jgi:hypothetical protein
MIHYQSFINGTWVEGEGIIEVVDPSSGETFATVSKVTRVQLQEAIEGAHRAFDICPGNWPSKEVVCFSRRLRRCESVTGKSPRFWLESRGRLFPTPSERSLALLIVWSTMLFWG